MNKTGRKTIEDAMSKIQEAIELLNIAKDMIEELQEEEQEKFDNMPENLQYSEKGEALEYSAETLQDLVDSLENVIDEVDELTCHEATDL